LLCFNPIGRSFPCPSAHPTQSHLAMSFLKFVAGLAGYLHIDNRLAQQVDATNEVERAIRENTRQLQRMAALGNAPPLLNAHQSARPLRQTPEKSAINPDDSTPKDEEDYEIRGRAVILLFDPKGRSFIGSGPNIDEACDNLTNHSGGTGIGILERALDMECVAFVADSHYTIRQVICREKFLIRCLPAGAIAELRKTFFVPADLNVPVGWKLDYFEPWQAANLQELLGRLE
jgi:hypothetical protein